MHIHYGLVWRYLKRIFFYNIFVYNIFQQPDRVKKEKEEKPKKTNSGFQSNVRSLLPNLDYKKEKAAGYLAIYSRLCE